MALPVHDLNFIQSFIQKLNFRYYVYNLENRYVLPTQKMLIDKLPKVAEPMANLYSKVQLVLLGVDPILRNNYSPLTQLVTEVN